MKGVRRVAVIDIGKTNAKVALVDLETRTEAALRRMPNRVSAAGPYPHHDVAALWTFILDSLAELNRAMPVDAISIATHGATAVLADAAGALALPVLDYEFDGPDSLAGAYDAVRPAFAETGSPRLPAGLNLGAQLFWQQVTFAPDFARATAILTYPQYWALRLSGVAASEITSLGCHTDLWSPGGGDFSTLVGRMGWRGLFPPLRKAGDPLGPILPALARRVGLAPTTPVLCGIHDSNASLYPHLLARRPPFAVVSTGTWVVAMAVGGGRPSLDPARDTLVNVSATGQRVPSARFMGGREYEILVGANTDPGTEADIASVLGESVMLLPSVRRGSGPFPHAASRWLGPEPAGPKRAVAAAFYLAMMTATCLDLAGAAGPIVLEGPFARNEAFARMLGVATGRPVLPQAGQAGTSIGAALLAAPSAAPWQEPAAAPAPAPPPDAAWPEYARRWRAAVAAM